MEAATSEPRWIRFGWIRMQRAPVADVQYVWGGRPPAISTFAAAMPMLMRKALVDRYVLSACVCFSRNPVPVGAAAFVLFPLTMHQRYTVVSLLMVCGSDGRCSMIGVGARPPIDDNGAASFIHVLSGSFYPFQRSPEP